MRSYLLFAALSLVACGGRVQTELSESDAAVADTRVVDSGPPRRDSGMPPPPRDVGPEPAGCATRLDPSFTCTPPEPRKGQKVCTDAMIQALSDGCFGESATSAGCNAAMKKYGSCSNCVIDEWIVDGQLAIAQCMQAIDPKSSCVIAVECTYDCLNEVCGSCDYEPGSGSGGGSEADDCWASEAESQCSAHVSEHTACISDPRFSVCYPTTTEDLVPFFRGACRDGGDWTRAYEADTVAVDAGTGG
jgi:hypothetical protein